LAQWNENKIPYYISEARGNYLETAYEICEYLSQNDIDIIACHGNDRINLLIPILSDVPKRVFVEHSGFPVMKEFDLVLTSLNGNAEKMRSVFDNLGTVIEDLPYGVDARADWLPEPPDFGISPQVKLLTTISNHLESRVSGKFVEAIGKILQRVPNAAYMPIGPVSNIEGFEKRFESYGVQDRVICLKNQKIPSQICRGMHLYLNEFPFGSGISMLDAMASGIPVVTMYDENGVMQAKNGGNYIGIDHAITSLNPDEYVELAVRLLTDVKLYAEWHQHALDRYELFGPQKYISNFEKIVYNTLIEKQ
jgi:glycosyltransferase involved in cell wall biosynthesis